MILAIDVGNLNIVIGCIDDAKPYFIERLSTDLNKTTLEYALMFKNILELYHIDPQSIEGGIVSSVVPPLSNVIRRSIEIIIGTQVVMIGPGLKTGLNIKIDNPGQLGSDMVVDSVAAIQEYPTPLIIIDMGTATTMSVIDKNKNYIGGVIIPGLEVALASLSARTSQLPKISLECPKSAIGSNTIECMKSGAVLGNAAILDGMIERIEDELGDRATVVATGNLAQFIIPYCNHDIIYDDALLIKGLLIIYEKNSEHHCSSRKGI